MDDLPASAPPRRSAGRAAIAIVLAGLALPSVLCVVCLGGPMLREVIVDDIPGACSRRFVRDGVGGMALLTIGLGLAIVLVMLPERRGPDVHTPRWLWGIVFALVLFGGNSAMNAYHSGDYCTVIDLGVH